MRKLQITLKPHTRALAMIVLAVALVSCGSDNGSKIMKEFLPDEVQGWSMTGPISEYDTSGIFEYMNGEGEVYRMFDYRDMIVQKYTREEMPEITVEIFNMGTADDAYGVFSHSRETEYASPGNGSEYYSGSLVFWQGRYLVSIVAEIESDETKLAVRHLAQQISERIPESAEKPTLLMALPLKGLQAMSVRYFHKHTTLNYHYYLSSDNLLGLGMNTDAVMGFYDPPEAHVVCIHFPNESAATEAHTRFTNEYLGERQQSGYAISEEGKWDGCETFGTYLILCLGAPDRETATSFIEATKKNIEKLL